MAFGRLANGGQPRHLTALGVPIIEGRAFTEADSRGARRAARRVFSVTPHSARTRPDGAADAGLARAVARLRDCLGARPAPARRAGFSLVIVESPKGRTPGLPHGRQRRCGRRARTSSPSALPGAGTARGRPQGRPPSWRRTAPTTKCRASVHRLAATDGDGTVSVRRRERRPRRRRTRRSRAPPSGQPRNAADATQARTAASSLSSGSSCSADHS